MSCHIARFVSPNNDYCRAMKSLPERHNRLWRSKTVDLEAWSSEWYGDDPQPRHVHNSYQLSLTRSGSGRVVRAGQSYDCSTGLVFVLRPGEVHSLHPSRYGKWRFDTLYFSNDPLLENARTLSGHSAPIHCGLAPTHDPVIEAHFLKLHESVVHNGATLFQSEQLFLLMRRLLTIGRNGSLGDSRGEAAPRKTSFKFVTTWRSISTIMSR